jgi:N-methylhydantoinase B/oxoprolinase/acetone carboxylase alpha subunit
MLPARFDALRLDSGDLFVIRLGRGGGWREPYPRDPEVAVRDVRNALISVEWARGINGVLVKERLVRLDVVVTEQIRAASRPEPE